MILILHGEDAFESNAALARCIDERVEAEWRSINLTVFPGDTPVSEVATAARCVPFFGNRMVVVRDCPWFNPGAPASFEQAEALSLFEADLPDACQLALQVGRRMNGQLQTTKAASVAAKAGRAKIMEFPGPDPYKPQGTVEWAIRHGKAIGGGITPEAARMLVARLGQDKGLLDQELRKLTSYACERAVTCQDIELLCPPGDANVFALVDRILERDAARALVDLRTLLIHDHALRILATMATSLRTALQQRALAERRKSADEIAAALKRHPYRVKKDLERLVEWTAGDLLNALSHAATADNDLKHGAGEPTLVMERLIIQLVGR
ncbi:MAG: DNA polymerase III subunit delta [Cyanobacteria bacterium REEB65]|nr:DNA polymerase III subunit delta [Cyanobacteria bacterium REEB65]